jgi:hypothetical protein
VGNLVSNADTSSPQHDGTIGTEILATWDMMLAWVVYIRSIYAIVVKSGENKLSALTIWSLNERSGGKSALSG